VSNNIFAFWPIPTIHDQFSGVSSTMRCFGFITNAKYIFFTNLLFCGWINRRITQVEVITEATYNFFDDSIVASMLHPPTSSNVLSKSAYRKAVVKKYLQEIKLWVFQSTSIHVSRESYNAMLRVFVKLLLLSLPSCSNLHWWQFNGRT